MEHGRTRELALAAHTLSSRDLLKLAGVGADELASAEQALALCGPAREAALRDLKGGPRLLAALELGRRAWMLPSPAGRRIRSPVDVAAVCAPRLVDDDARSVACALDSRMTLARLDLVERSPGALLRFALSAGTQRLVLAINRRGARAIPTPDDEDAALRIAGAGVVVDVALIDVVILGDDGFCSLLRLGLLPPSSTDPRYR